MSGSIACAMQKLLIAMLIFQQLLSGVHSLAVPAPVGGWFNPGGEAITDKTDRKRRTKVSTTVL